MSMGKLLAYSAMNMGYNVSWIPSYGAEVRGGTAHSMIRIEKNKKISNPVVSNPNTCIVMSEPSMVKFMVRIKPKGLLLLDDTRIGSVPKRKDIMIKRAPFTEMAQKIGDRRVANIIAIGALNKIKSLFPLKELVKCLPLIFQKKQGLVTINERALAEGYALEL